MPPAPFFPPSPRHAKPGKSGNFEPTRGHFSLYLMSIGCIAHGFREVPGRAHSGGVPFGNQSPRPRRCGASLACRLASPHVVLVAVEPRPRATRPGHGRCCGHQLVRPESQPLQHHRIRQAPAGIKEMNYSSILCPLSRFGGSARPAGGIALPVGRGPSRPCPTLFLFRRPRCPARPRPPYKRPAATACSPHLVLLRLSDHPQQQQPNRQSFA